MDYISEHFTKDELETTETGLPNECPTQYAGNAIMLAEDVLEPARVLVGPLHINSWFRCPEVNAAVGGEKASAHLEARAADVVPRGKVFDAFKMLVASDIPYDKIIFEHHNSDWIHIQVGGNGHPPRRLVFTAQPENGKMVYTPYNA